MAVEHLRASEAALGLVTYLENMGAIAVDHDRLEDLVMRFRQANNLKRPRDGYERLIEEPN